MRKLRIADIIIEMDCRDEYMAAPFLDFLDNSEEKPDVYWAVKEEVPVEPTGEKILSYSGFDIFRNREGNSIDVRYNNLSYYSIYAIIYENQYQKATIYLPKPKMEESEIERMQNILMAFQREMFFFAALSLQGISIHSASIIYKEKGIAFSAISGTGKSTHTNLWNKYYNTPILDGDVTLCRVINGISYIYGLPWSGSSELYLNQRVELRAVIFLTQGKKNVVERIQATDTCKRWLARSFTSRWFSDIIQKESGIVQAILSSGVCGLTLSCNVSKEAVDTVKVLIDEILEM